MKLRFIALLALLLFSVALVAQAPEKQNPESQAKQAQEFSHPSPRPSKRVGHPETGERVGHPESEKQAETLGGQLAEASNEAAGEEDETAAFKHSPSVRWVASITGLNLKTVYWVLVVLNFAIIAGLIAVVWKAKIPALFRSRTAAIQKGMEEARKASEEASRRLGGIEERLAKLDSEIAAMRAAAEADAATEDARIRAAAEEDKHKVVEMAEQEIAAAARTARRDLKAFAAELAVTLAAKRIQVDAKTDQALVRSFVNQLGEPEDGGKERR